MEGRVLAGGIKEWGGHGKWDKCPYERGQKYSALVGATWDCGPSRVRESHSTEEPESRFLI